MCIKFCEKSFSVGEVNDSFCGFESLFVVLNGNRWLGYNEFIRVFKV